VIASGARSGSSTALPRSPARHATIRDPSSSTTTIAKAIGRGCPGLACNQK